VKAYMLKTAEIVNTEKRLSFANISPTRSIVADRFINFRRIWTTSWNIVVISNKSIFEILTADV